MHRKSWLALLLTVLCFLPSVALAGADYQWTMDDYIWTFQSKRVNGVPIGDALNAAFPNVSWQAGPSAENENEILGLCYGGTEQENFELLVRFTSYFSFEIEQGLYNGDALDNPSQWLVEILKDYQSNHQCSACEGLGYTDACLNCSGSGSAYGKTCMACGGSGKYACKTCRGYGIMTKDYTRECPFCDGSGGSGPCSTCDGSGQEVVGGILMMCTDCLGSGEAACSVCSSNGMIKMGYLVNS